MSEPVRWTEVRVLVPIGWHELVADVLSRPPCTSVAIGRTSIATEAPPDGFEYVRTFIVDAADTPAQRLRLECSLSDLAQRTGASELAGMRPVFLELPAEDWATSWKKSWKPFRVGKLCVVPSWYEGVLRASDVRMILEPVGAFGSGRHATTRTCLRVLQDRLIGGENVLDAGSGSGILSVAAVLLGARSATGFDVDSVAQRYAEALADDNGTHDRCRFRTGDFEVLTDDERSFDVVLANLYSDLIQEHARELALRLRPGGWFAFSGCPAHHAEATRGAITRTRLHMEEERIRGRWHTFVGSKAEPG